MATNMAELSTTQEWDNFFEELVRLLTDYEALYDSPDCILQENVFIRMESALLALQQVIPSAIVRGLNCASVLQEIFTNFRILFLELTRRRETQTSSTCSNLAIYSLEIENILLELRSYGFTWKQIADMLLVPRWTIKRHVVEYGLRQGRKCLFLQGILHCGLTTFLTVVSVVVDNVYELLTTLSVTSFAA